MWRSIQEDKREYFSALMAFFPLARTPGDNRGASAMRTYARKLERMIKDLAPWVERDLHSLRRPQGRSSRHSGLKSGEVVVILDKGDRPNDPLYEGAEIRQR